jgi:arylsulfatase A-like enzyme
MSLSGSGTKTESDKSGWIHSLRSFWRREFGRPDPTRVGDLVVFPLAVSATAGLITGVCFAIRHNFLDPAFIGYSIGVDVLIQIVILFLVMVLAFITRRKIWSGVLFAIGFFCFLAIPDFVKIVFPGASHRLGLLIALLGAFQVARAVNRHVHSRFALWMIAAPALVVLGVLSYGPVREISRRAALPAPQNSPNVLIIIVDTLRADHLSTYGYTRDTSPYLTHLAQQGVLFENAIAPSSWTLPSHASMMTGLYPRESHVEEDKDILSGSLPTLGDAMESRGYRTAAFSANYGYFCRYHGFIHGFTHFEEYEQSIGGILEKVRLSFVILTQLSRFTTGERYAFFGVKNAPSAGKIDEDALDWIETGRRPFFVVLNYFDVHDPVLPPEPYLHMYTTNTQARSQSMQFQEKCVWFGPQASCDTDRPQFVDTYDGATHYVDSSMQHLLSQLNDRGILQNTIVVFTSDHGQELGDHGLYGHGKSVYWAEIQVPLVIWKPGLVPASIRVPTPVSTTDIPATILDLVAPDDKQAMPGRSLAALWNTSHPVSDWPEPISEVAKLHWFDEGAPDYNAPVQSVVTPDWHYIRQQGKDLLFNWKTDPDETHDQCSNQPAECTALRLRLQVAEGSEDQAR